jgi:hypothetical protein
VLDAFNVQLVPMAQRKHDALEQLRPIDSCLWKILLLIFVIVGFIVLNIHSHCVDPR